MCKVLKKIEKEKRAVDELRRSPMRLKELFSVQGGSEEHPAEKFMADVAYGSLLLSPYLIDSSRLSGEQTRS